MIIAEPDVALTDYALALETTVLAYLVHRRPSARRSLRAGWVLFFGAGAVATLAGGTVHGFFPAPGPVEAALWALALLAVGVTALAAWAVGALVQFPPRTARWIVAAAVAEFAAYAIAVASGARAFALAVADYLPAALFLLVVFFLAWRRTAERPPLVGGLGLGVTFLAAWVQVSAVALPPLHLGPNTLYHLIQAVALLMIFVGARWTVTEPKGGTAC